MPAQNSWLHRRVIAYAHQGGAWEAPSSTLAAIEHAVDAGATAIELDVHATADGHLVVCHDTTVDRTTDGLGAIAELTLAEIEALDNAHWFIPGADVTPGCEAGDYPLRGRAPHDRAYGVARLRTVLEAFPGVVLNLDIKRTAPAVIPYEEALAELLAEFDRRDDVIVASFLDTATAASCGVAPHVPTSAGTVATAMFHRAVRADAELPPMRHVALQVPESYGEQLIVDEQFVEAAHGHGLAVHVWTVNDPASMHRLLDKGVDGIISDVPTTLVDVLGAREIAWDGLPGGR